VRTPEFIETRANVAPLANVSDRRDRRRRLHPLRSRSEEDFDHVYVKIYWSARMQPNQNPTPSQTIVRLSRRPASTPNFP